VHQRKRDFGVVGLPEIPVCRGISRAGDPIDRADGPTQLTEHFTIAVAAVAEVADQCVA
jgi:hypothetical protein